ncbi:MarR family winged helix-turn-helix transcriptional regulator [Glycomyces luteolus]|uniref:MarR family winged helix-turn-helix transcriptional regulator n=1 Tax=Glycomyces luteolus TaxID=2670330 RepID=A0A9X3PCV2_9ACTN|nr:MarR family winged helix-turn-helix transcriptional regulator [Glycomyces luteolus]MDA1362868.1 MarR family winged helix-turn-helix transcriptional regulator [Glycomyces luteolus]
MENNAELRFDLGDKTPRPLKRQFSRLMGMTAAQVSKVAQEALNAVGANKFHFVVLATLHQFGPSSQAAIADRTGIYRSDLVAVINTLEEGGYARRGPDPADKRRNVITMTEAGTRRFTELDGILAEVHEHVMAPLGEDEREQLFSLLTRVNAHLAGD